MLNLALLLPEELLPLLLVGARACASSSVCGPWPQASQSLRSRRRSSESSLARS
jgi:hypothetical protein